MEKSLFLPASLFLLSFDMKILLYTNKIVLTLIILYSVRSFFYKCFISAYVFLFVQSIFVALSFSYLFNPNYNSSLQLPNLPNLIVFKYSLNNSHNLCIFRQIK